MGLTLGMVIQKEELDSPQTRTAKGQEATDICCKKINSDYLSGKFFYISKNVLPRKSVECLFIGDNPNATGHKPE